MFAGIIQNGFLLVFYQLADNWIMAQWCNWKYNSGNFDAGFVGIYKIPEELAAVTCPAAKYGKNLLIC